MDFTTIVRVAIVCVVDSTGVRTKDQNLVEVCMLFRFLWLVQGTWPC